MSRKSAKVLLFISTSFVTISAQAQDIKRPFENAPYSRYGLGEEMNAINPALKAMGSISSAYTDGYTINTENPASYASLKYATYEVGAEGRSRTVIASDKYRTGSMTISYLNIALPLGKYAGMNIGYRPMTSVGYTLEDSTRTPIGKTVKSYEGDGGTNMLFVGAAGKYKGLSVGANLGYIFGTIQQSSWYRTDSNVYINNSEFTRFNKIGGLYYKLGAIYEIDLPKDMMLKIGGTLNLSQKLNNRLDDLHISHPSYASDTTGADTAYSAQGAKNKITMPMRYSAGIHLSKGDVWNVGIDYSYANWSQFNNPALVDSIGKSAYRISIGGVYTPNSTSLYNYWQRVNYRLGFYYGKDFVSVNDQQMNYYAVTFGLSLPFKRSQDRIHAGMELGKIGSRSKGTLEQNFIRLTLGVSFNDRGWFVKRRYD